MESRSQTQKTVVIAGATGYLGHYLVAEYRRRGWRVRALVRSRASAVSKGLVADELFEAEATRPETLAGLCEGTELVVSCLGITRQQEGLSYRDVDYQANQNILSEALAASVPQFAYVHVLGAEDMPAVELVAAKQAFVDALRAAPVRSTVISPTGYFSDMKDFLKMAQAGRVWLFGDGQLRLNPIHGADLATAIADACDNHVAQLDVGGPDIFTHMELAELAFSVAGRPVKITRLPDGIRKVLLWFLPKILPASKYGPPQFFLTAMGVDMVGDTHGTHHLVDAFRTELS